MPIRITRDVPVRRIRSAVACPLRVSMRTTSTPSQEPLMPPTHDVFNQSPALTGYDVADDPAMLSALRREGGGWAEEAVRELGRLAGSARTQDLGRQANENPPVLHTHDRFWNRIDEVEFHPAWDELMQGAGG